MFVKCENKSSKIDVTVSVAVSLRPPLSLSLFLVKCINMFNDTELIMNINSFEEEGSLVGLNVLTSVVF